MAINSLISLIGPDGAGKTTIANELVKKIPNSIIVYMGRAKGNIIPIDKIKVKVKKPWMYFFGSFVYFFNLLLRYWFYVFPLRFFKTVISDRYMTDIYLMKNVPLWLRNVYLLFIPKPTYTFLLYEDLETLIKRKNHDKEDLIRQMVLFDKINAVRIKNEDVDKTVERILFKLV